MFNVSFSQLFLKSLEASSYIVRITDIKYHNFYHIWRCAAYNAVLLLIMIYGDGEELPMIVIMVTTNGLPTIVMMVTANGLPMVVMMVTANGLPMVVKMVTANGLPMVVMVATANGLPMVVMVVTANGLPMVVMVVTTNGLPMVVMMVTAKSTDCVNCHLWTGGRWGCTPCVTAAATARSWRSISAVNSLCSHTGSWVGTLPLIKLNTQ